MGTRRRLIGEFAAVCTGRRKLFRVGGDSMMPTLAAGDVVAIDVRARELPAPGQIVVVSHPSRAGRTLIKRVRSRAERTFAVGSDNPFDAIDSRAFGSLTRAELIGTVCWIWSRQRGFRELAK